MAEETITDTQDNPIYKFLKDNKLTTKNEDEFLKEYSNPEKQKELHKFMHDNQLTTKDFDTFSSDNFGALKKYSDPKTFIKRLIEWFSNIYTAITNFPNK
jgi:hypothetical protein